MSSRPPHPPPPQHPPPPAPPDRFCDLVMNGGVTSGVVFPRAIAELSRRYRFHGIAGGSVGAMAAAVAAAAEYGRRGKWARGEADIDRGFEVLEQIASGFGRDMSRWSGDSARPVTRLRAMFQPQAGTRRLFDVFMATLERPSDAARAGGVLMGLLSAYRGRAGLALALALAAAAAVVWQGGGWSWPVAVLAAWVFTATGLVGLVAFIGLGLRHDIAQGLVPNGFGLCTGMPGDPRSGRAGAITPWLHRSIQRLVGRDNRAAPLSFRDLHAAPGAPLRGLAPNRVPHPRSIDLRMMTSNVTHGRPYSLPHDDPNARLFFDPAEWARYFPRRVIEHLCEHGKRYGPASAEDPPAGPDNAHLIELPGDDLPIVVAARLSLSFPLLFSAVPLWAVDHEMPREQRRLQRCWFSDAGLSSNFPVHLFDSAVPSWPTFGIQLTNLSRYRPDAAKAPDGDDAPDETGRPLPRGARRVTMSRVHRQGATDSWERFDGAQRGRGERGPVSSLVGFVVALVLNAKDWHDNTLARLPGVRERVVRIALDPDDEGGLNLDMPKARIDHLVGWGRQAGRLLRARYTQADGRPAPGWNEHRWIRLNNYLRALRRSLDGVSASMAGSRHTTPTTDLVTEAMVRNPLADRKVATPIAADRKLADPGTADPPAEPREASLSATQAEALQKLSEALQACESALATHGGVAQPYQPSPEPRLRMTPPD